MSVRVALVLGVLICGVLAGGCSRRSQQPDSGTGAGSEVPTYEANGASALALVGPDVWTAGESLRLFLDGPAVFDQSLPDPIEWHYWWFSEVFNDLNEFSDDALLEVVAGNGFVSQEHSNDRIGIKTDYKSPSDVLATFPEPGRYVITVSADGLKERHELIIKEELTGDFRCEQTEGSDEVIIEELIKLRDGNPDTGRKLMCEVSVQGGFPAYEGSILVDGAETSKFTITFEHGVQRLNFSKTYQLNGPPLSFPFPLTASPGTHDVSVHIVDAVNNSISMTKSLNYRWLDPALVISIIKPDGTAVSKSHSIQATVDFRGNIAPVHSVGDFLPVYTFGNLVLEWYVDGSLVSSESTDFASERATFILESLSLGDHKLQVRLVDHELGREGTASVVFTVVAPARSADGTDRRIQVIDNFTDGLPLPGPGYPIGTLRVRADLPGTDTEPLSAIWSAYDAAAPGEPIGPVSDSYNQVRPYCSAATRDLACAQAAFTFREYGTKVISLQITSLSGAVTTLETEVIIEAPLKGQVLGPETAVAGDEVVFVYRGIGGIDAPSLSWILTTTGQEPERVTEPEECVAVPAADVPAFESSPGNQCVQQTATYVFNEPGIKSSNLTVMRGLEEKHTSGSVRIEAPWGAVRVELARYYGPVCSGAAEFTMPLEHLTLYKQSQVDGIESFLSAVMAMYPDPASGWVDAGPCRRGITEFLEGSYVDPSADDAVGSKPATIGNSRSALDWLAALATQSPHCDQEWSVKPCNYLSNAGYRVIVHEDNGALKTFSSEEVFR